MESEESEELDGDEFVVSRGEVCGTSTNGMEFPVLSNKKTTIFLLFFLNYNKPENFRFCKNDENP